MADGFFPLSPADRRDALDVAAARSGRAVHLLEKDVWVVWTVNVLFASEFADDLVFKGGTSLSKAYQAIGRFSEDVDLTYDIRAIAPDLAPDSAHAIPSTRSQEQRWTTTIRERLDVWVTQTVAPRGLARRVAEHKTMFFRERDERGDVIDYETAVMGALRLAPDGPAEELLAADYAGSQPTEGPCAPFARSLNARPRCSPCSLQSARAPGTPRCRTCVACTSDVSATISTPP